MEEISSFQEKYVNVDMMSVEQMRHELKRTRMEILDLSKNLTKNSNSIRQVKHLLSNEIRERKKNLVLKNKLKLEIAKQKLINSTPSYQIEGESHNLPLKSLIETNLSSLEKNTPVHTSCDKSHQNIIINSQLTELGKKTVDSIDIDLSSGSTKPAWKILHLVGLKNPTRLLDSVGHMYCLQGNIWHCSRKLNLDQCNATVLQYGDEFYPRHPHTCQPKPNIEMSLKLTSLVKKTGIDMKFEPANNIVREAIETMYQNGFTDDIPDRNVYMTSLKIFRSKHLPPTPKNLFFEIDADEIPEGFLRGDVFVGRKKRKQRHLIFANEKQIKILEVATLWYMDVSHKIVSHPFFQVLLISGFQFSNDRARQITLAFVVMSRASTQDYEAVFNKLLEILEHKVRVEEIVCDYQEALWQSAKICFPHAKIFGCDYRWTQDVIRAIKLGGLVSLFKSNENVEKLCRRLMLLNLLPPNKIPKIFKILKKNASKLDLASQSALFLELFNHVEKTWITNSTWTIDKWSSYGEPLRHPTQADKDIKKFSVRSHLVGEWNFYQTLLDVYTSCSRISSKPIVLARKDLFELPKKSTNSVPYIYAVNCVWNEYEVGDINALQLLKKLAKLRLELTEQSRLPQLNFDESVDDKKVCFVSNGSDTCSSI